MKSLKHVSSKAVSLREGLLNLVFPPRCVGCGKAGRWLCTACCQQVEYYERPWQNRVDKIDPLLGVRSAARFSGPLRQAIHSLKYEGLRALAPILGEILNKGWQKDPWPVDAIVPVPLHRQRELERGYNQSALLARELARHTSLPVLEGVLSRTVCTVPQVGLNRVERALNVHQAFSCADNLLSGRSVLLIDDVLTTGATLRACAVALLQADASAVWGLTLAHE